MPNENLNDEDWPFETWLKLAVFHLGLSPTEFWNLSLRDWFALTRQSNASPMTKDRLIKMELDYEYR